MDHFIVVIWWPSRAHSQKSYEIGEKRDPVHFVYSDISPFGNIHQ